jgi:DNA-binding SARP family transcriptional activator
MTYLRLLGGACIEGREGPLSGPVTQRHRLALLALLASADSGGRSRDKLLAILWPGKDARRAGNLLRQAVHYVRKAAGPEAIGSSGGSLVLDPESLPSDLRAFREAAAARRWRDAVELYRGPFLDGFHLPGSHEFDRWAEKERLLLAERNLRALETLAESAEGAARWNGAVRWWTRRTLAEPTNSRVVARLMDAMAAAGNLPGALAQARRHRKVLERDLGIPLPEEIRARVEELTGGRRGRIPSPRRRSLKRHGSPHT